MKFVMLGRVGVGYIAKAHERHEKASRKAGELGISVLQRFLTLGRYDFCTIIEAPNAAIANTFSLWYRLEGLGEMELLVAHEDTAIAEMTALLNVP